MRVEKKIYLSSIKQNYLKIKKMAGKKLFAVVKADAYGHGLYETAKYLKDACDGFAVATTEEALNAVEATKREREVLLLGRAEGEEFSKLIKEGVSLSVYEREVFVYIDKLAKSMDTFAKTHISVNTGMNRTGASVGECESLVGLARSLKNVKTEGIYSHFYDADNDVARNIQLKRFLSAVNGTGLFAHISATGAIKFPECILNGARAGLGLYGYGIENLSPSMVVKCRVIAKNRLIEGDIVGYGGKFVAKRPTVAVTLSIGYADGFLRNFSGIEVLIRGKRRKIIGNVCMDCCFAEADEEVKIGDEAIIVGKDGNEVVTAKEIADRTGTIPYEILCGFKRASTNFVK